MPVTPELQADLERRAQAAAAQAYAPYSGFFVGAAILLASGHIVIGCNVENSSYRLTCCAEQNAIAAAVAQHGPNLHIRAVAIYNQQETACSPCGACRQTIAEFAAADALIVFPGSGGVMQTCTLADLLPSSFRLLP